MCCSGAAVRPNDVTLNRGKELRHQCGRTRRTLNAVRGTLRSGLRRTGHSATGDSGGNGGLCPAFSGRGCENRNTPRLPQGGALSAREPQDDAKLKLPSGTRLRAAPESAQPQQCASCPTYATYVLPATWVLSKQQQHRLGEKLNWANGAQAHGDRCVCVHGSTSRVGDASRSRLAVSSVR